MEEEEEEEDDDDDDKEDVQRKVMEEEIGTRHATHCQGLPPPPAPLAFAGYVDRSNACTPTHTQKKN